MTLKRALLAVLILAIGGWIAFVVSSFRASTELLRISVSSDSLVVPAVPESVAPAEVQPSDLPQPTEVVPSSSEQVSAVSNAPPRTEDTAPLSDLGQYLSAEWRQQQCDFNWERMGAFVSPDELRLGGTTAIDSMPDSELKDLADSGDFGYAQIIYAWRLLGPVDSAAEQEERLLAAAELAEASPSEFAETKHYFVEAMKNHNRIAAYRLSEIYRDFDPIEARAWLLIDEQTGGGYLGNGAEELPLDALQEMASETRASELIEEFELAGHLSLPDECL